MKREALILRTLYLVFNCALLVYGLIFTFYIDNMPLWFTGINSFIGLANLYWMYWFNKGCNVIEE